MATRDQSGNAKGIPEEREEPVLDLETSESNLERPDPRLDTTGKSGSPDAGANRRREDETLH